MAVPLAFRIAVVVHRHTVARTPVLRHRGRGGGRRARRGEHARRPGQRGRGDALILEAGDDGQQPGQGVLESRRHLGLIGAAHRIGHLHRADVPAHTTRGGRFVHGPGGRGRPAGAGGRGRSRAVAGVGRRGRHRRAPCVDGPDVGRIPTRPVNADVGRGSPEWWWPPDREAIGAGHGCRASSGADRPAPGPQEQGGHLAPGAPWT